MQIHQHFSGLSEFGGLLGGSPCMLYCTSCIFSPATASLGYQHPVCQYRSASTTSSLTFQQLITLTQCMSAAERAVSTHRHTVATWWHPNLLGVEPRSPCVSALLHHSAPACCMLRPCKHQNIPGHNGRLIDFEPTDIWHVSCSSEELCSFGVVPWPVTPICADKH